MGELAALCRALVQRGWFVTAAERTPAGVIVGFDFMPNRRPSWLKAFEVPESEATPAGIERRIEVWKARVRADLRHGRVSDTVRRMLAEHGPAAVEEVMRARASA